MTNNLAAIIIIFFHKLVYVITKEKDWYGIWDVWIIFFFFLLCIISSQIMQKVIMMYKV